MRSVFISSVIVCRGDEVSDKMRFSKPPAGTRKTATDGEAGINLVDGVAQHTCWLAYSPQRRPEGRIEKVETIQRLRIPNA